MPKDQASDLITDREMAFARRVLAGNDRETAQSVGLNPDTAADTKSKPCVRAYMLGLSAAVQQQFAEQEAEGQRRLNLRREQVLHRLLELANVLYKKNRWRRSAKTQKRSNFTKMEMMNEVKGHRVPYLLADARGPPKATKNDGSHGPSTSSSLLVLATHRRFSGVF